MGQTLVKNYLHLVFATKDRYPFITEDVEEELFAYIGGICRNMQCGPIHVGGYRDHIHLLCNLSKNMALARLMEEVKGHSSKWIKSKGRKFHNFYWQEGYGAFSVDYHGLEPVTQYILNQKQHHKKKTFQEEYRQLLEDYKMDFNESYLWD